MRAATSPAIFLSALLVMATAAPRTTAAQEFCIACTGPDAVYRCVLDASKPVGLSLKKVCIGTLARLGAHAECKVRKGTVFDCNGPIRRIDASAAAESLLRPAGPAALAAKPVGPTDGGASGAVSSSVPGAAPTAPRASATAAAPSVAVLRQEDPQATSKAAAPDRGKASAAPPVPAESALASTARKTWGCLASLFKHC
ncbi:MAG: hypothetical protein AB7F78_14510 [Hyphomicrobiaceae bacterium]